MLWRRHCKWKQKRSRRVPASRLRGVRHRRNRNLASTEKRGTGANRRGRKPCQEQSTSLCELFFGANARTHQCKLFFRRCRQTHQRMLFFRQSRRTHPRTPFVRRNRRTYRAQVSFRTGRRCGEVSALTRRLQTNIEHSVRNVGFALTASRGVHLFQ